MIADSPDATRAAPTCAWCEHPLADPALRNVARRRCPACGATTLWTPPAGVPALDADELLRRASAARTAPRRRQGAKRICTLGEAARRHARRRLAARVARIAPPGPVLDVGSGDRMLLDALRATGRLVTGIASGRGGSAARAGVRDVDITELGGRYAAIVFWQSLGRLPAPGVALEHAAALLKPGGLLAIAQPRVERAQARALGERWLPRGGAVPRVHIPEQTLLARLRALGLEIEHVDHLLDADRLVAGDGALGWLHGVLGGVVSIEARR